MAFKPQPTIDARRINALHHPSAATAAVVTVAADPDRFFAVRRIDYSYDAVPAGGSLTIAFGSAPTTYWSVDITAAGDKSIPFHDSPFHNDGAKNEQMVITLADPGGAVVGKLNVIYSRGRP